MKLYVRDIMEIEGEDGLLFGWHALLLFRALVRYDHCGTVPELFFQSPHLYYTEEFFQVLFGLVARKDSDRWVEGILKCSDLETDPVLVALCKACA